VRHPDELAHRRLEALDFRTQDEAARLDDARHGSRNLGRKRLVLTDYIEYWDPHVAAHKLILREKSSALSRANATPRGKG